MTLVHDTARPFEVVASQVAGREWGLAIRRDHVRWPDGTEADYHVVEAPDAAYIVAYSAQATTVLVRQWRHAWDATAWEVPAGTLEPGEDPLAGARRELGEEAGLAADEWTSLGVTRGSGSLTGHQHLYLARGLRRVQRRPETYEQDMIVRELPFAAALEAALTGEIEHAAAVAALVRAARALGIL